MRTVIVVSNYGDVIGGGEVSLLTLLKGLDRTRWRPVLVVPSDGTMVTQARALDIQTTVIPMPTLIKPGMGLLRGLWRLGALVRATDAALLHANGSRPMFYAGLVGRLLRRPVIWHLRILEHDRLLDWLLARLATWIIVISKPVQKRLEQSPSAYRRCTVVPNGIDLQSFVPSMESATVLRSLNLDRRTHIIIGTVGRLVPFKGHRYLLQAVGLLKYVTPPITLLVVGDGPELAALQEKTRALELDDSVRFLGHRDDIPDVLATMDVFVLPSLAECFGRVLIEAMALRLPVVATAAGGVPEVVIDGSTGILVPPGDPNALAKAIATLLEDRSRMQMMGAAGRERVERHFNLRLHAERVEAVYLKALELRTSATSRLAVHSRTP